MRIPTFILKQLYVKGSLRASPQGLRFALRNTLAGATLTGLRTLKVDGRVVEPARVRVRIAGREVDPSGVSASQPLAFPRDAEAEVHVEGLAPPRRAKVRLEADSAEFGELVIEFEDEVPP